MEKKLLIVSLLFALVSIESFSQTGERRYYYAYNEKKFLNEVEGKMVICFERNNAADVKTLINSEKIEWQNDSVICIVEVENARGETLKRDLLQIQGIKSVHPMYATADGMEMGLTNEIVMRFNEDVSQQQIDELHRRYQVSVRKITNLYQLVTVPNNMDAMEIANQYQLSGLVKYSHPSFMAKVEKFQTIPNDPYFVNQYYLHNTGQTVNGHSCTAGADIRAPQAWDITMGDNNIIVAIIDEGVSSNHPDLPDSRQVRLNGSNMPYGNDPSPSGDGNHGNACAGIIAASHNQEGIAGIAPNCKIMPVRIPFGIIPPWILALAITFAKDNGADVLSNSWGYGMDPDRFPVVKDAIEDATLTGRGGKGCVVVFSTGNAGFVEFPSNVDVAGVLTVGASDRNDMRADYSPISNLSSSYRQIVDIVAPSHRAYSCKISTETFDVWTIDIPGSNGYNPVNEVDCDGWGVLPVYGSVLPNAGTNYLAYTGHFGGTSAACPQVAGVAALILSVNPNLTQAQVASIIKSTARKAGSYNYQTTQGFPDGTWNDEMGHGVVNAYAAVSAAQTSASYQIVGTVFPFSNNINTTVKLFEVPSPLMTMDPLGAVLGKTTSAYYLRHTTTAVKYDGTVFIPSTPKYPGILPSYDNPGYTINWDSISKPQGIVNNTLVTPGDTLDSPAGVYFFNNVIPGDYVLGLFRDGFVPRLAKITVPAVGGCLFVQHREIIGGDANSDRMIDGADFALVTKAINNNDYNVKYDINGDGVVDGDDYFIIVDYNGFEIEIYKDTKDWVDEYR